MCVCVSLERMYVHVHVGHVPIYTSGAKNRQCVVLTVKFGPRVPRARWPSFAAVQMEHG